MSDLQVGSKVWILRDYRRVYRRDANGKSYGRPIERESFLEVEITGSTRDNWILHGGTKINKKTLAGIWLTEDAVNQHCWISEHRTSLSRKLLDCADFDTLRQVAVLLNYDDTEWPWPTEGAEQ